jgi:hypothetical protein
MKGLYWVRKIYSNLVALSILFLAVSLVKVVDAQAVLPPASNPEAASSPAPDALPKIVGDISSDALKPKSLENWNTPSLQGSDLTVVRLLPGIVSTIDDTYTQQIVRVTWRAGDPVDLYIVKPVGVKNPPVIFYFYNYPITTEHFADHNFCKLLVKNGYAAVGFAPFLIGQRYHDVPMKQWFMSELRESLAASSHDVQMALNFLARAGDLDTNHVGIYAEGSGASIAILAAAADARIKTLDLVDPWGDWPDWVAKSPRIPPNERANFLQPEWLANVAPLDPVKWLPKLQGKKVRVQFIKNDPLNPVEAQKKVEAAIPASAAVYHYDDEQAFRFIVTRRGRAYDWLKENLPADKGQSYRPVDSMAKGSSKGAKDSQQ